MCNIDESTNQSGPDKVVVVKLQSQGQTVKFRKKTCSTCARAHIFSNHYVKYWEAGMQHFPVYGPETITSQVNKSWSKWEIQGNTFQCTHPCIDQSPCKILIGCHAPILSNDLDKIVKIKSISQSQKTLQCTGPCIDKSGYKILKSEIRNQKMFYSTLRITLL